MHVYLFFHSNCLEQHFMNDTSGASIDDKDKVLSGFPSFYIEEQENLGYLAYGGIMVGDTHRASGK